MAYKALKSFVGSVNMRRGEIKEIDDEAIVKDLIRSGLVEEIASEKKSGGKSTRKNKGGEV